MIEKHAAKVSHPDVLPVLGSSVPTLCVEGVGEFDCGAFLIDGGARMYLRATLEIFLLSTAV